MKNIRDNDGIVHVVRSDVFGLGNIISECTVGRMWTANEDHRNAPDFVEEVDEVATCLECFGRRRR